MYRLSVNAALWCPSARESCKMFTPLASCSDAYVCLSEWKPSPGAPISSNADLRKSRLIVSGSSGVPTSFPFYGCSPTG